MSNPSPECLVKDGGGSFVSTAGGVNVTPGDTITIKLNSQAGVESWLITCATSDELSDPVAITSSLTIDPFAQTATFTYPGAPLGRSLRFFSQVNGGNDVNGVAQPTYEYTFCIYSLTAGGLRVGAADETTEGGNTGWGTSINELIRNPNPGSGEANTASSSGSGASLVLAKSGVNLPFRAINGLKSTTAVVNGNNVDVDADGVATLQNSGTGNLSGVTTVDGSGRPTSRIVFTGAAPVLRSLTGGIDQRCPLVLVASGGPLVITNEYGSDPAANRLDTGTGGDITIPIGAATIADYDAVGSRWRVLVSGITGAAVVFNDSTPANKSNITTTRVHASAMDNTKLGITNLGNDSTNSETGATGAYCTLAGDRCSATATYAICIGHFSVATGTASISLGDTNVANASNAVAIGTNNTASGAQSTAIGNANLASGQGSTAIGNANSAAGLQSTAMGGGCTVTSAAIYGHAIGFQNQVYAGYGHALGTATQCWGGASNTFGEDTITTANRASAMNEYCEAHGLGANAFGGSTKANGDHSTAQGSSSIAAQATQRALASGNFSNIISTVGGAQAQTSEIVLRGRTPGSASGESVALQFGEQGSTGFQCLNERAYTFYVTATCAGIVSGSRKVATIKYLVTVRTTGGTATIVATNLDLNTAASDSVGSWDLSFGVSGLSFGISFTTGTTTAKCAIAARVEFTETIYFLSAPTTFPGCSLWLVSDTGVSTIGGNVSAWADQSGSALNFTQGTAGNRPALVSSVVHGRPAVRFNGTTQSLNQASGTLSSFLTASDWTFFAVVKWDPAAASGIVATPELLPAAFSDSNGYWGLANSAAGFTTAFISDGVGHYVNAPGSVENTPSISAIWERSTYSAPIVQAFRHEEGGQHCSIQQASNIRALTGTMIIGQNFNGTLGLNGDVYELIGFNRSLSDEERCHVYQYLKDGWQ